MSSGIGSLVKKGKNCVAVAKNALDDIGSGRKEMTLEKLSALQRDGGLIANESEKLAKRLEGVDNHCQNEVAEFKRKMGDLKRQESQLRKHKLGEESQLSAQQNILYYNQNRLSSAESNLQNAERKRRKAEKEAKNIQIGSTVGGALFGLLTGGVGFVVGAVAGAGIGAMVNACRDEERDARAVVNHCRCDLDNARSAVNENQRRISNIESQIRSLTQKIGNMQRQHDQLNQKVGKIKKLIVIAKQSVEFWRHFKDISVQDGIDCAACLRKIVTMAAAEGDYQVLQLQPSQRIANTFIEAWEKMEATLEHGGPNHVLEIEYRCSQCSRQCTALPYADGSILVCMQCHSKQALQN